MNTKDLTKEPKVSKKVRRSPKEIAISKRVDALIQQAGTNPNAVARKAGIDSSNFGRMINGERGWKVGILEKIARSFGLSFTELVDGPIAVPIVARISALEPFPYPETIEAEEIREFTEYTEEGTEPMALQLYAVELHDRSMMPAFAPGTKFIAEKDSERKVQNEELVICPDDQGMAQICRVIFTSDQLITLKNLNPTVPDRTLPRHRLKTCDIIVKINHR